MGNKTVIERHYYHEADPKATKEAIEKVNKEFEQKFKDMQDKSEQEKRKLIEQYEARLNTEVAKALKMQKSEFEKKKLEIEQSIAAHQVQKQKEARTLKDWLEQQKKYIDKSEITLLEELGAGAFATVHKAIYKPSGMKGVQYEVAVKVYNNAVVDDHETSNMVLKEIKALTCIEDDNVVQVIGACENPLMMVMELVEGETLHSCIHIRKERAQTHVALDMLIKLAETMARMHAKGVSHRDLKCQNILISGSQIKIVDFGLGCICAQSKISKSMSKSRKQSCGRTVIRSGNQNIMMTVKGQGTPLYMAPEAHEGGDMPKVQTFALDVYSFAIIMWETLSGMIPYSNMNFSAVAVVNQNLRPTIPPKWPQPIRDLITQCWAKDPNQRPKFDFIVAKLKEIRQQQYAEYLSTTMQK